MQTQLICVTQHYRTKRWGFDFAFDDPNKIVESSALLGAPRQTQLERHVWWMEHTSTSTHPLVEVVEIWPPLDGLTWPEIRNTPTPGFFYGIVGHEIIRIVMRHQLTPYKTTSTEGMISETKAHQKQMRRRRFRHSAH